MQHDPVEAPGEEIGPPRCPDRCIEDAVRLALRRAQLRGVGLGPFGRARQPALADHLVDAGQKIRRAAPPHGDRRHDWNAELSREAVEVDLEPAMAGDVEHVEREDHRPADALQLEREAQRQPEIGRVGDTDEQRRNFLACESPQHDVPGDDFVEAAGTQRIGPRQIDQPDRQAGRCYRQALLALDGDTGVVRDLLTAAGQRIEQRGLAAVGIADERNPRRRCNLAHPRPGLIECSGSTRIEAASRRRSATVASLMRTAIGSRPNNP
jgi:hypothetical protein